MTPGQLILSILSIGLGAVLGCWGVLTYFNAQNKGLWQSTEAHILGAIAELKKQISEIRSDREKDHERIHQMELAFLSLKGEMAEKYLSRPEFNRMREGIETQVAQVRTFCSRKQGEASS